jgi:hypothetical protein
MNARKASALATVSRGAMMRAVSPGKFRVRTPWSARTYEEQAQQKFEALLRRTGAVMD